MNFADAQFKMLSVDAKGTTLYESLKIVAKTGFVPKELVEFESTILPSEASEVWQDFLELSNSRQYTSDGPCPITYRDIEAWASFTGKKLSVVLGDIIFALDRKWLDNYKANREKLSKKQ